MCVTSPKCGRSIALEYNGDVYSCDHFVYPDHKLGNILKTDEGQLVRSPQQLQFGEDKYAKLTNYCRNCRFIQLCWGECPKNRFVKSPEGENGHNYLCQGLEIFYNKVVSEFPKLALKMQ